MIGPEPWQTWGFPLDWNDGIPSRGRRPLAGVISRVRSLRYDCSVSDAGILWAGLIFGVLVFVAHHLQGSGTNDPGRSQWLSGFGIMNLDPRSPEMM